MNIQQYKSVLLFGLLLAAMWLYETCSGRHDKCITHRHSQLSQVQIKVFENIQLCKFGGFAKFEKLAKIGNQLPPVKCRNPAGTWRNNNVIMMSKRRRNVVLTSQRRYHCVVWPLGSIDNHVILKDIGNTFGPLPDRRTSNHKENPSCTSPPKLLHDLISFFQHYTPHRGAPYRNFSPDKRTSTIIVFIGPPLFSPRTDGFPDVCYWRNSHVT